MQARPTFPATVAGKDTTVIEIGPEGEPIRSGSAKALADVAQVLVVVDPRALPNVVSAAALSKLANLANFFLQNLLSKRH